MSDLTLDASDFVHGPKTPRSEPRIGLALRGLLVCAAYYFGSLLGFALLFPSSSISIIWPPNTILLVALLLSPRRQWPWLLLMAFAVHALAQAQFGESLSAATRIYAWNCVLVLLTAAALRRVGLADLDLGDLRQALLFIAVTTISVAASSLVWAPMVRSAWLGGDLAGLVALSNLLPFLIATPGLVIGLRRGAEIVRSASLAQYAEFAVLALGLLASAIGVFGLAPQAIGNLPALSYAPLPFLLWAAVRFGPGGLSFAFLIFALMAMFNTVAGHGPFVTQSAADSVLWLQIFLLALYVPLLVLASVVEERRGKEEALRGSEARYRAVVEDQTELICRFLPDGTYTFVNDAYCRYFQRAPEELLGRKFWAFIPPEGHQAAREFLASITPDRPVATREHEVLGPGGELRWRQWRDRAFFDDRGRIVEYQAVGRDITERKHSEDAMQGLAHAARLAVVGELTGSIAHEINQPLGAILSNAEAAELLLESESPSLDEVRKILADIRKDDLRASEVIQRVRALLHKRELSMLPLDLNEVAEEVVRLVSADAHRRNVALETEFASGPTAIRGDRVHLQQVLLNLLLNGMEAMIDMPQGARRIVVRTERTADQTVKVSVSDTGHGIPSDRLPHVFDSFFTTKEHGIGLGLAIARSIVEVHGGRIWASNDPGGGATFSFTLPAP
jgi:two-component system, LuxR family, sensor kinase FixL